MPFWLYREEGSGGQLRMRRVVRMKMRKCDGLGDGFVDQRVLVSYPTAGLAKT